MSSLLVRNAVTAARNVRILARRSTIAPIGVRVGILLAGVATALLANPHAPAFAIFALLPALFPRSSMTSVYLVVALALWIEDTESHPGHLSVVRLIALAATMYYVHAGAALAAVLPYDAVYTAGIFGPWLARIGVVTAITAIIAVGIAWMTGEVTRGSALEATLSGLVVVIATTIFLGYLGKRRQ